MFGPPGTLYVYLSYGMHMCVNVTCGPDRVAAAVLIRAGEVIDGADIVAARRPAARRFADLARGPGTLGSALGIGLSDYGIRLFEPSSRVRLELSKVDGWEAGPRVGVSVAPDRPWRLWLPGSPAVSVYRRSPRAPAVGTAERSVS
jgi:DNA-3-methyladenine glycosylase